MYTFDFHPFFYFGFVAANPIFIVMGPKLGEQQIVRGSFLLDVVARGPIQFFLFFSFFWGGCEVKAYAIFLFFFHWYTGHIPRYTVTRGLSYSNHPFFFFCKKKKKKMRFVPLFLNVLMCIAQVNISILVFFFFFFFFFESFERILS